MSPLRSRAPQTQRVRRRISKLYIGAQKVDFSFLSKSLIQLNYGRLIAVCARPVRVIRSNLPFPLVPCAHERANFRTVPLGGLPTDEIEVSFLARFSFEAKMRRSIAHLVAIGVRAAAFSSYSHLSAQNADDSSTQLLFRHQEAAHSCKFLKMYPHCMP